MQPPARTIRVICPHCGQPYEQLNGFWLRRLRKQAGLTQLAFAARVNMRRVASISYIENNHWPCPDHIARAYLALTKKTSL
jgi:DNA-binding XRE family transcriptional regulator